MASYGYVYDRRKWDAKHQHRLAIEMFVADLLPLRQPLSEQNVLLSLSKQRQLAELAKRFFVVQILSDSSLDSLTIVAFYKL